MPYLRFIFFTLLLSSTFSSHAVDLSKIDYGKNYAKNVPVMHYQMAEHEGRYRAIFEFDYFMVSATDSLSDIEFTSQEMFESERDERLNIISIQSYTQKNSQTYEIDFTVDPTHNYLVVKVTQRFKTYLFDIPIHQSLPFPLPGFLLKPVDSTRSIHRMTVGDKMQVVSLNDQDSSAFFIYKYEGAFNYALAPMMDSGGGTSNQNLDIIQSKFPSEGLAIEKGNNLYFIQKDTISNKGQSFMSHTESFPEMGLMEELIKPLVYISTKEEYEKLIESTEKRKEFERYWLKLLTSKEMAARGIKKYYNHIELANRMFSSYKEGWKTDMGMIYIIFGKPDRVTKTDKTEIWFYKGYKGDIKFTFVRQANLFTQYHYVLVRNADYKDTWYGEIRKWRKGNL